MSLPVETLGVTMSSSRPEPGAENQGQVRTLHDEAAGSTAEARGGRDRPVEDEEWPVGADRVVPWAQGGYGSLLSNGLQLHSLLLGSPS